MPTASTYSNLEIVGRPTSMFDMINIPVASATIIADADLVNTSSGYALCVDASTDNASYAGISAELSRNGDTKPILVYCKAIFIGSMGSSSTLYQGAGLKYSAGPASAGSHSGTTDWSFAVDSSGGDIICWARENLSSSTGPFRIYTDSFIVGAGIGTGSGFWEGAAA